VKQYLLIESRDPYESGLVRGHFDLALSLYEAGHAISIFLVQNAVLPARPNAAREALAPVLAAGIEVLADEFSLRERGIEARDLKDIQPVPIDVVVERMAAGWKTIFL
jgi:sulfur relay (sulfurtransferase) DsrF/TusC family protein